MKRILILLMFGFFLLPSCEKEEDSPENSNNPETVIPPTDKRITTIAIQGNAVWVGTDKYGLYKFENEEWKHYSQANGFFSDTIQSLCIDNDNTLWVGTKNGVFDFKDPDLKKSTDINILLEKSAISLACDALNNIWIGTRQNVLIKYDRNDFVYYNINPEASHENQMGHIHTITDDLDGNIWVGSCISGLSKFNGTNWTDNVFNITMFAQTSICTNNGDLWVGRDGIYRLSNGNWSHNIIKEGLNVNCLAIDKENKLWLGSNHGLYFFNGSEWIKHDVNIEQEGSDHEELLVERMAFDHNGDIWIGNRYGILKIEM